MKNHVIPLVVTLALLAGIQFACAQTITPLQTIYSSLPEQNDVYPNVDDTEPVLMQASDGNFYGTINYGGPFEGGMIFRLTTNGVFTSLHPFNADDTPGHANPGGSGPVNSLVQAGDGNLYGVTTYGSTNGYGSVFRITTNNVFTTLYAFKGTNSGLPDGGLVLASDGNLYGTTTYSVNQSGTIFRITTNGVFTLLYMFSAYGGPNSTNTDGAYPVGSLVQVNNGLYGVAQEGGFYGYGTVFCYNLNGNLASLYSFTNGNDGAYPYGHLTLANDQNLYGVTFGGPYSYNSGGTIFRVSGGGVTPLCGFHLVSENLGAAITPLILGSDGNLYGTAYDLPDTIFCITTSGILTPLKSIGSPEIDGLFQANNGNIYGTTSSTVYQFSLLPPQLNILSGASVLFWPGSGTNWVLQCSTNPASTNWTTVTNGTPVTGISVPNSSPAQFFRLANP